MLSWYLKRKETNMEISIYPIPMGLDTIYVVRGESVILIDGGDPHAIERLKEGVEKACINPEEIRLIILTHGHWDHIGSAKDIKDWSGAKVMLHQRDMHLLDDAYPSQPPGFTLWGKIIIAFLKLYSPYIHIPKFDVDIVAGDEDISLTDYGIAGKVVYTPGHSWGSVSVVLDSGEAFVGDLAMNMLPMRLNPGLPIFGDDILVVKKSWQKLLDMGAKTFYPAHGKSFSVKKLPDER
jgi:glyoxylase-like metal-dependent hydrolase (beta-lactamase superfamily II)